MNVAPLAEAIEGAEIEDGYGPVTVTVPATGWRRAVQIARDDLRCDWFDFLSAVEEGDGFSLVCHLARTDPFGHVLLRARLPQARPRVASVAEVYGGADWHERETAEMFGVDFTDGTGRVKELPPLLLPPGFTGHPLLKDFALAARVDRPWPGAVEPGRDE